MTVINQTDDDFDFDAMMSDIESQHSLDAAVRKTTKPQVRHTCEHCNGTGEFTGHWRRVAPRKCIPCGGKGYFLRSAEDRAKDREAYRLAKAKKSQEMRDAFEENNPGLIQFLRENQWSDFFISLLNSYEQYCSLTENQIRAARSAQAKIAQKQEERKKQAEARKVSVDLTPIKKMFDAAQDSGLMRTKYRAEGLELSLAGPHSRNAGAIYAIRDNDGQYLGKIMDGVFQPVREATEEDKVALLRIAQDPKEAAVRWGRKTGRCSCCGRLLTDSNSIAAGIGPICATKWNL